MNKNPVNILSPQISIEIPPQKDQDPSHVKKVSFAEPIEEVQPLHPIYTEDFPSPENHVNIRIVGQCFSCTDSVSVVFKSNFYLKLGFSWHAFSRLARCRPGYGYINFHDITIDKNEPDNDGVFLCNLNTNENLNLHIF